MGIPEIIINFIQKAESAIKRSAKGIVLVIVDDITAGDALKSYKNFAAIDEDDYTADTMKVLKDAFAEGPNLVHVLKVGSGEDFDDVKTIVDNLKFNWMCYINADSQATIATYVKTRNVADKNRKIKAVCYNLSGTDADDDHVVNFCNETVTRVSDTTTTAGHLFLARITGMLAAMPFTKTATYYRFTDLSEVAEPADLDAAVNAGKFIIMNDCGEPKVARAVNSLTTLTGLTFTKTDDWKKIAIIEAMDIMTEDISEEFKNNYIGQYKNNYDNQCLFLSAVNEYFRRCAREQILDDKYDNHAYIDVEAQRNAWVDSGRADAEDWDEQTVKNNTYHSTMFLGGQVKILDGIEDLQFNINMF